MLEIKEYSKKDATSEFIALHYEKTLDKGDRHRKITHVACHQQRPQKDPVHKSVILEVNMVYDDKTWVKE